MNRNNILSSFSINTPLGLMLAIADEQFLYFLHFADAHNAHSVEKKLCLATNSIIVPGITPIITSLQEELAAYFMGTLKEFKTPCYLFGTDFQQTAWKTLQTISYGQTKSYKEQAILMKNKSAYRAVANANAANRLAIIIPCHRIINSNNNIWGYNGGIHRKKWLLDFERQHYAQ